MRRSVRISDGMQSTLRLSSAESRRVAIRTGKIATSKASARTTLKATKSSNYVTKVCDGCTLPNTTLTSIVL